ncbi:MBL fold metallo-hydrolase [Pedobacter borealis]|uniref:MBL fold metallo-hydrolase n=1 Tax=Pedobacter borealis TaxID=475254 RepID=UPI00068B1E9F|nr:MBL fold metallo-hydrolase [Pedobacter borealis]
MKRRELLKYTASAISLTALPVILKSQQNDRENKSLQNHDVMKIQRLAWAGIKIELGETTLYIDATSYDEQKDMKLTAETEYRHALITHHHPDHYDPAALKTVFDKRSRLYCYEDVSPWLDTRDFRIQPVKLHQPIDASRWTGDLVAIPVPAVDGFGHPQVSWVVQGGGKKIIHCGDTLWHGYWRDIAIAYGPFDIAFMPINAARLTQGKVEDTGIPAVMNPEQAVVASKLLNAKSVCPIHYGRPSENYFETPDPEKNFLRFAKERNAKPLLLNEGEYIILS